MTSAFDIGDKRRFNAVFQDDAGIAKDPSAVTVSVRDPAGVVTNPSAVNDSVGFWHVDISFNLPGRWIIKIIGTGAVESAEKTEVWIREDGI